MKVTNRLLEHISIVFQINFEQFYFFNPHVLTWFCSLLDRRHLQNTRRQTYFISETIFSITKHFFVPIGLFSVVTLSNSTTRSEERGEFGPSFCLLCVSYINTLHVQFGVDIVITVKIYFEISPYNSDSIIFQKQSVYLQSTIGVTKVSVGHSAV